MKSYFLIPLSAVAATLATGESLLEIENAKLDENFRGSNASKYYSKLTEELNTADGEALIKKLLSDKRLKNPLYSLISKIENDSLRDNLILFYVRDDATWENTYDGIRDRKRNMAAEISECIFINFPSFRLNIEENDSLTLALFSPEGREAIGATYEKFLALPISQRDESNPKMVSLVSDFREIFAKFGTVDYLNPADVRLQLSPTNQPRGNQRENKHTEVRPQTQSYPEKAESAYRANSEPRNSAKLARYLPIIAAAALIFILIVSWLKWQR